MFKTLYKFIYNLFPYKIEGENNKIFIVLNGKKKRLRRKLDGLNVIINGKNIYLEIELPINFKNTTIHLAGENAVFIMKHTDTIVNSASFYVGSWGRCFINENIRLNQPNFKVIVNNNERFKPHKLVIGKNAQIGRDISIRTSDGHSIFKEDDILPYNEPQDILIGDNVWIAQRVTILKGSKISSNSVIGACSLVNKEFNEPNVIIAGNPAKVIKHNIRWERETYGIWKNKYNNVYQNKKNIKSMLVKRIKHKFLKFIFRFYF